MKRNSSKPKVESQLDPYLPISAGTGIPYLKEGEGSEILKDGGHEVAVTLSRRAFWIMWEQAEALAKKHFSGEIKPFPDHAAALTEAVAAFRRIHHHDKVQVFTPKAAEELRENERKRPARKQAAREGAVCPECGSAKLKPFTSKKTGKNRIKCKECGKKWTPTSPSEAVLKPVEAPKASSGTIPARKSQNGSKKKTKKVSRSAS